MIPKGQERCVEGFALYDIDKKRLIEHPYRYALAHHLEDYVRAAFSENSAIESSWDRVPLTDDQGVFLDGSPVPRSAPGILQQAAECFALSHLSTYLTDYFPHGHGRDHGLVTLSHSDIPDVLLQNVLLKLFSEPIEDRAAFVDLPGDLDPATLYSVQSPEGARYERLELTLPDGSTVRRDLEGQVTISTKRFDLTIRSQVPGHNALLPAGYEWLYLGHDRGDWSIHPIAIRFVVSLAPRRLGLMNPRRWHHYRWIDKWVADFERDVAIDAYFDRIGYETAYTTYTLMKQTE